MRYRKVLKKLYIINIVTTIIVYQIMIYNEGLYMVFNKSKHFTFWGIGLNFLYCLSKLIFPTKLDFNNIFFNIAFISEILINSFYWFYIYQTNDYSKRGFYYRFINVFFNHIFPLIFVLIEFILDKKNFFKLKNLVYIIILDIVYLTYSLIFVYILNDVPYRVLNFKSIKTFINLIYFLIFLFFLQLFFLLLKNKYINRKWKNKKIKNR